MDQKRYFHELEQSEIDILLVEKKTVGDVLRSYKQPEWCDYPDALEMSMGCWSLCDMSQGGLRTKISREYCKNCDCFVNDL
jgi:hypothetical protein